MNPALVILAAGESRRLGACKALVDLGGLTPLARLLEAGRCMDGATPLVVAGVHADRIARALPADTELVENERWSAGRTTSVACAAALRPGLDLCIAPVDVPLVEASVFESLRAEWERRGEPRGWLQPCWTQAGRPVTRERCGHPVVLGTDLAADLARALADPDTTWNDFPLRALRARARRVMGIDVPSPRILDDLDTLEDLERLRGLLS